MDAYRIATKFFLAEPSAIDRAKIVPMFHRWIQRQAMDGHMLIDVADYQHVPSGPGIVLVSHEANLSLDETDGQLGLLYARKRELGGNFAQRLSTVLGAALHACKVMEEETSIGAARFATDTIVLKLLDRLAAPNTEETYKKVRPEIESLFSALFAGPDFEIARHSDERMPFELRIRSKASPSIDDLLARLSTWREPFVR